MLNILMLLVHHRLYGNVIRDVTRLPLRDVSFTELLLLSAYKALIN